MPLPIIADTFRTVLGWTDSLTGLRAHNVIHFQTAAAGKTPTQVYTCLNAHVTQSMWSQLATTAIVTDVTITPLDGVSAAAIFSTGSPSKWQGAQTGGSLPQVASEIKFATPLRGPAHRGRIFLPFVAEDSVSGRTIANVASVNTAWLTFLAAVAADATTPMSLVVASYVHSSVSDVTTLGAQGTTYTVGKRNKH